MWQKMLPKDWQRKSAVLTYLMLSLAVGYQLKCCYGSRQSNAWLIPGAQSVIDEAEIDQWHKRLKTCVKANGRHFEHLL